MKVYYLRKLIYDATHSTQQGWTLLVSYASPYPILVASLSDAPDMVSITPIFFINTQTA